MPAMREVVAVFVAGGAGAVCRLVLSSALDERAWRLPIVGALPQLGTLMVNLLGCFAIGVLAATVPRGPWRTIVGAGLLGGFTTYSAFALLTFESLAAGRWVTLVAQCTGHLVGGVLAVALGWSLGGLLLPGPTR